MKADELIKQAERLKSDISRPPGKYPAHYLSNLTYSGCDDAFFQSIADVDKATRDKIGREEAVDLVKLPPRNKYKTEDHQMQIMSKDGQSFYVPIKMSDKETQS